MFNSSLLLTAVYWCSIGDQVMPTRVVSLVCFPIPCPHLILEHCPLPLKAKCNASFLIIVHPKLLDGVNLHLKELWGSSDANTYTVIQVAETRLVIGFDIWLLETCQLCLIFISIFCFKKSSKAIKAKKANEGQHSPNLQISLVLSLFNV